MTENIYYEGMYSQTLEDYTLKPNQRLVLVHPTAGFLPLIVHEREFFYMLYDRLMTNAGITSLGAAGSSTATVQSQQLFDNINRDMVEVKSTDRLHHLFMGISPPQTRVFVEFPKGTTQHVPDNQNFSLTATYGYIDGWASPFQDPSPVGELILPWGRNMFAVDVVNPTSLPITNPVLRFVGYTYVVEPIRNTDLVQAMLEERPGAAARKVTLGGLQGYPYDPRQPYDADFIPFDWQRSDITRAVAPTRRTILGGA